MSYKKFRPQRVNANKHTEIGLAMLDKSIRGDGWIGAITVAADGETFDGSARLERVADVMPSAEPIIVESDGTRPIFVVRTDIPDANDPRAKRLGVAANSIAAQDYNPDGAIMAMLAAEDEKIKAQIANDDKAIRAVLEAANEARGEADAEPQIDRAAELNEKWGVKFGDLWAIGDHRLLCGDSTRREDVERVMGGEKADMVFTDPPYGIGLETDLSSIKTNWNGWEGRGGKYSKVIGDDKEYDATLLFVMFPDVGEMFIWGANYFIDTLPNFGKDGSWFVWDKKTNQKENTELSWKMGSEFELCWSKSKHKQIVIRQLWQGLYGTESQDVRNRVHPTQKPLQVITPFVGQYSKDNDLIADPFAGSGTTFVAGQNLGRKVYGLEISPSYCAVILERMSEAFPALAIHRIEA